MKNILIVDDEQPILQLLTDHFSFMDYHVLTAANGIEALKQAEKQPDLILLDINMPQMNGLEVCSKIRQLVSCPILFVTAKVEEVDKIKGLHVGMDYHHFEQLMGKVDVLIGGKSSYAEQSLVENFGRVDKTYEEALAEYELIKEEDQFTNAYARYFADYTGIILLILPIFIITALSLKDQGAGVTTVIYSRSISSFQLVMTRFLAVVCATFLPVLFVAIYETYRVVSLYPNELLDYFAFVEHAFIWLLPTILVVVAFGFFVTEWSGTILAIVLQFALFFVTMSIGLQQMEGGYSLGLIALRHNIIGNTQVYVDHLQALWINRVSYTALAFVLLGLTIGLYEQKRKGMRTAYEWIQHVLHARRS